MTSFFFKFVFLNSLLSFFAIFEPSLGAVDNDGGAALRDMAESRSNRTHGWQVVGGEEITNLKDYNFIVLIRINTNEIKNVKSCTGTIVSIKIVVTAGNCVCDLGKTSCPNYIPSNIQVYAGSSDFYHLEKGSTIQDVYSVNKHPNFGMSRDNQYTTFHLDLAVIKIKSYFVFNDKVNQITLANNEIIRFIKSWEGSHMVCEAYGLGISIKHRTSYMQDEYPLEAYSAEMKLVEFKECLKRWKNKGFQVLAYDHLCATGYKNSVCMTDNGGGLRVFYGSKWYFIGVATLTENCGSEEVPSVFTRIDATLQFINKNIYGDDNVKSSPSSGDFIHNKLVAQYYGGPMTSILLLTIVFKSGF